MVDTLKIKLKLKLTNMALVLASKKIINNKNYYGYYKLTIYKLLSFDKFIELLEKDIIKVNLVCRVSRSGLDKGRQRNKNLVFQMTKNDLNKLFITKFIYNHDLH